MKKVWIHAAALAGQSFATELGPITFDADGRALGRVSSANQERFREILASWSVAHCDGAPIDVDFGDNGIEVRPMHPDDMADHDALENEIDKLRHDLADAAHAGDVAREQAAAAQAELARFRADNAELLGAHNALNLAEAGRTAAEEAARAAEHAASALTVTNSELQLKVEALEAAAKLADEALAVVTAERDELLHAPPAPVAAAADTEVLVPASAPEPAKAAKAAKGK